MRLGICALQSKWRMYGIPVCSGARTCPHQSWWHTGPHVSMGTVKVARRWFGLFFSEEIPPFLRFQYLQLTVVEDRWSGYCHHWVSLIHLFCLTFVNFFFTLSQLWHGDSVSVLSPDPDLGLFFFSWCLHLLDIKKKNQPDRGRRKGRGSGNQWVDGCKSCCAVCVGDWPQEKQCVVKPRHDVQSDPRILSLSIALNIGLSALWPSENCKI